MGTFDVIPDFNFGFHSGGGGGGEGGVIGRKGGGKGGRKEKEEERNNNKKEKERREKGEKRERKRLKEQSKPFSLLSKRLNSFLLFMNLNPPLILFKFPLSLLKSVILSLKLFEIAFEFFYKF